MALLIPVADDNLSALSALLFCTRFFGDSSGSYISMYILLVSAGGVHAALLFSQPEPNSYSQRVAIRPLLRSRPLDWTAQSVASSQDFEQRVIFSIHPS